MKTLRWVAAFLCLSAPAYGQPVLLETQEFPSAQPGPSAVQVGEFCFWLASGTVYPGDVDWIQVRIPKASSQTIVDVDFPAGAAGSALLASVVSGGTSFNIADNNNVRDGYCGLGGATTPVGSPRDSAVDARATPRNTVVNIAITGAEDTGLRGLHTQYFTYDVWVYVVPAPCTTDADCNDGIACTVDSCEVATGDCFNVPDHVVCDDGFFCNGKEWCDAARNCRAGAAPECDDGVGCTIDWCDWDVDECVSVADDGYCDNGFFCDGAEWCDLADDCQPGDPPGCDDGVSCTFDACDDALEACVHTPDDEACDNGLFCDGVEWCDALNDCQPGDAPDCDDGVGCTADRCDEGRDRCVSAGDDSACDNGLFCDGQERCDVVVGCRAGLPPECDDGVGCTVDACDDALAACVHSPDDGACDDGVFCNGEETCDAEGGCRSGGDPCPGQLCRESDGRCVECLGAADCDDGDFCNGPEACDAAGVCRPGQPPCGPSEVCDAEAQRCEAPAGFTLDIRPGVCPNRVMSNGQGVLAVAVVGSAGSDVADVNVRSLRLSRADGLGAAVTPKFGPPGPAWSYQDVATPFAGDVCGCNVLGADGVVDLVLRFDTEEVFEKLSLGQVGSGRMVELVLSGNLRDGELIELSDCVSVQIVGRRPKVEK